MGAILSKSQSNASTANSSPQKTSSTWFRRCTESNPQSGRRYFINNMESQLYDDTYEQLLIETDPAERNRIIMAMGDDIYDTYRTIPIVNIRSTLVVNPEEVSEYKFGSLTGVFGHLEYAKAAR